VIAGAGRWLVRRTDPPAGPALRHRPRSGARWSIS